MTLVLCVVAGNAACGGVWNCGAQAHGLAVRCLGRICLLIDLTWPFWVNMDTAVSCDVTLPAALVIGLFFFTFTFGVFRCSFPLACHPLSGLLWPIGP